MSKKLSGNKNKNSTRLFSDQYYSDKLKEITDEAIRKRIETTEFHGLEKELRDLQVILELSYEKSKQISHPRDKGEHRENILRNILIDSGLVPKRFHISTTKVRAVSPSGHVSPELDIVIFGKEESIVLRRMPGTLDYMPIECLHGNIQVKSKLNRKTFLDALDNIRKFKSLVPKSSIKQQLGGLTLETELGRRFGIIFAYEIDMKWEDLNNAYYNYIMETERELWPNAIFVMNSGHIFCGSKEKVTISSYDQCSIEEPGVYGYPDLDGSLFFKFYEVVLFLLNQTPAGFSDLSNYWRMPLTAGRISYSFPFGPIAELIECTEHGPYLKKIKEDWLKDILSFCKEMPLFNWREALKGSLNMAAEGEIDHNQSLLFKIYNPENLDYKEIFISNDGSIFGELVKIENEFIWLSYYYIWKNKMFEECPKCSKAARMRR